MKLQITDEPPFQPDFTELFGVERIDDASEEDQAKIKSYSLKGDHYEIKFTKKYDREKLEAKLSKAEAKVQSLQDRIAEATDFADLKAKITKAKDSEDKPTKWSDKEVFLEGERIEHKGDHFYSRSDHTASKDAEPQDTPDLYRPIPNT